MAAERLADPDWQALADQFPKTLVDEVHHRLDRRDSAVLDPELLGEGFGSDVAQVIDLLQQVARHGSLLAGEQRLCGNCDHPAEDTAALSDSCSKCGQRYGESDPPFKTKVVFRLPAGRGSRDISWVVTAHGMNTDGPWQQEFSWLIANKLKYSAPVLILKYPVFRVMVLFERTQRLLVKHLGQRLKSAIANAKLRGDELREAPDLVLHSYGTLLFSRLLLDPEFEGLKFDRLVLGGSIVPPDYDWAQHIKSGRIKAVINHCGTRDWVVLVAEWAIPGTGPSGRRGYVDKAVTNVRADGFSHGTFFEFDTMRETLAPGGAWDRFLTYPSDQLAGDSGMTGPASWNPNVLAKVVRGLAKLLAVLGLGPLLWFGLQVVSAIRGLISAK